MAQTDSDLTYKSTLDAASLEKAKDELGERNENDRRLAVHTLRQWVLEQRHLRTPTDFSFLLRFLRVNKFSQLEARKRLENYWRARSRRPEWFRNVDPADPKIQEAIRLGATCFPQKRDKQNRKVMILNFGKFDVDKVKKIGKQAIYRAHACMLEYLAFDEAVQVEGFVLLVDYSGVTLSKLTNILQTDLIKDMMSFFNRSLPMRFKGRHIYNEPSFLDVIYALILPMMSEKMRQRVTMHGKSLVNVYEQLGYECLPDEYLPDDYPGPTIGSCETVIEEMITDMCRPDFRDYIRELSSDKYGIDESKMQTAVNNDASFRKIAVD